MGRVESTQTLRAAFGMLYAMSTPSEPVILAEDGALVIAESGPKVLVIDRGKAPTEITVLLLTMTTLIFGGFGLVSIFSGSAGSRTWQSAAIGAVLLAIGIGAFRAMVKANEALHRVHRTPLSGYVTLAVFDREYRSFRDSTGEYVATLDEVRIERRRHMLTSSLIVQTPSGPRVLKRSKPFRSGFGTLTTVLENAVHRT
jgi:hypothetical protein